MFTIAMIPAPDESLASLASLWQDIVETHSPETIEVVGSALIQIFAFLLPALGYQIFDLCFPQVSQASKIQRAEKQPSKRMIWRCIGLALFNHSMLIGGHAIQAYFIIGSMFRVEKQLPSATEVL